MIDFQFLQNPISKEWVILAPRRAKRPDVAKGFEPACPFCPGREGDEKEVYRIQRLASSESASSSEANCTLDANKLDANWLVRVIPNKFPFAPIHEVIIHSPEHSKNFDLLSLEQVELILKTYRQRFLSHQDKGNVYIFHNHSKGGGESLPHPHTQLAVIPFDVKIDIPRLDPSASAEVAPEPVVLNDKAQLVKEEEFKEQETVETENFYLFCPKTSQWPDETWIAPKKRGRLFSEITDEEITDLAFTLQRLIKIFDLRHGSEFPFNFYIYPGGDWYLRLIPRLKSLGGFEIGTKIFINTQDPEETIAFIKEHFHNPDEEKIKNQHQAEYGRHV